MAYVAEEIRIHNQQNQVDDHYDASRYRIKQASNVDKMCMMNDLRSQCIYIKEKRENELVRIAFFLIFQQGVLCCLIEEKQAVNFHAVSRNFRVKTW